jgi:hypothetical protein
VRKLQELKLNEGGEPVHRPKPTPDQIAFVENLVGARLPRSYIDFLLFSNGGHPELDTFSVGVDSKQWAGSVDTFFHISSDQSSTEDVVWNYNRLSHLNPRTILPIAQDGGGNIICLDLGSVSYGEVLLWTHDLPGYPLLVISSSFEDFLDRLTVNPAYR